MKFYKVLIPICLLASTCCSAQSMDYFAGHWKFDGFNASNKTSKPDYSAEWQLEKTLQDVTALSGYVTLNGAVYTRELIAYNPFSKLYTRTITTNDGNYVEFTSKGWLNNKLTWTGKQYTAKSQVNIKEEIGLISDTECKAVFFREQNHKWVQTQTEILKKSA